MFMHKGTQTITTKRLVLRKFIIENKESVYSNWANDKDVQNGYGEPVYSTLAETTELLQKYISAYENPEVYRWGIFLKDNLNNCIGQIAYFIVDSRNQFCEIEYCIGKAFQNKGYTTEAIKAIIKFGFENVCFNRIQVSHRSANTASKRVIEKSGFTYEGTLRKFFNHFGEFQDRLYYSILKDEWEVWKEIDYYNSLPIIFNDFIDVPPLSNGEIELVCVHKEPAIPEKKWVPSYEFEIRKDGIRIGMVNLRIGYDGGLNFGSLYYGGQIGYGVDESFRGNGYAEKACRLLIPVIKAHSMKKVIITNDITNMASKRTCEKLGAKFIRVATLPQWHDLYKDDRRMSNIFEWNME